MKQFDTDNYLGNFTIPAQKRTISCYGRKCFLSFPELKIVYVAIRIESWLSSYGCVWSPNFYVFYKEKEKFYVFNLGNIEPIGRVCLGENEFECKSKYGKVIEKNIIEYFKNKFWNTEFTRAYSSIPMKRIESWKKSSKKKNWIPTSRFFKKNKLTKKEKSKDDLIDVLADSIKYTIGTSYNYNDGLLINMLHKML